jgi:peptidoglycan/LPS O-acetylase OafA/YrhL
LQNAYSGRYDFRYRPDIDGLRAVAILAVMLGHVGVPGAQGGFVGVDIFFVISGYLIAGNVARSIAAGEFSIGAFFRRRILRIAPALACMLAVTSAIAAFVLPPLALVQYGESLIAAVFSYSNLYFWTQAGYFNPTVTKLLLHTWSLGVEEQFYLVLPVTLLLAARGPKGALRWTIALAGAASFASAAYLTFVDRDLAFYLPFTRAWELLAGSVLALGIVRFPWTRAAFECATVAAVLAIVVCIATYSPTTPFPGLAALPPCLAALLLIAAGESNRTIAGAVLGWRPIAFVGKISYSVYLWHWPMTLLVRLGVFPRVHNGTRSGYLLAIALSLVLGALSWRFVERPFLGGRSRASAQRGVFTVAGAVALVLSGVAALFIGGDGLPGRFSPDADRVGNYLSIDQQMRTGVCFLDAPQSELDVATCLTEDPHRKNVLLLGDSHAAALWWGLHAAFPGVNLLQANAASCPVTFGSYDATQCGRLRRYVYDSFLASHSVDAAILTQRWDSDRNLERWEPSLRFFREHRIPVVLVGPVPEYSAPLPMVLALGITWNEPHFASGFLRSEFVRIDDGLRARLAGRPGVRYASAYRAICASGTCATYADRERAAPMLSDGDHLTNEGSTFVVRRLLRSGELLLP